MLHFLKQRISRHVHLKNWLKLSEQKLNLGCGKNRQEGYINVDVRPLPTVDYPADMNSCVRTFEGLCDEIYISHVLEHFENPGKAMRDHPGTVLGLLKQVYTMLKPGGLIRVAVPDFEALAKLYLEQEHSLAPRLLGRLCGEQDYPENMHKCLFDKAYLTHCLELTGFTNIKPWFPKETGLNRDSSFDELDGIATSLNLIGQKASR